MQTPSKVKLTQSSKELALMVSQRKLKKSTLKTHIWRNLLSILPQLLLLLLVTTDKLFKPEVAAQEYMCCFHFFSHKKDNHRSVYSNKYHISQIKGIKILPLNLYVFLLCTSRFSYYPTELPFYQCKRAFAYM